MVANYNTSQFLASCLDSLCNQTYKDFEVLVIDDGSTDNSVDIIDRYIQHDRRFRLIKLGRNHGLTHARHIALHQCKGEYVAILDADDIALPSRLEKQTDFLDTNPDVVLLGSYFGIIDPEGKIKERKKPVPLADLEIRWRLTFGNCYSHSSIMYRKEPAMNCGGYDKTMLIAEDVDFYSRIIALGEAAAIGEVLVYWRNHPKSLTQFSKQAQIDKYSLIILQNAIKLHTGQSVDKNVANAVFFNTMIPAVSLSVFKDGIKVLMHAFEVFLTSDRVGQLSLNRRTLSRCLLKHLFKIYKRNHEQEWWKEGQADWIDALNKLLNHYKYRWYTDWHELRYKFKLCRLFLFLLLQHDRA